MTRSFYRERAIDFLVGLSVVGVAVVLSLMAIHMGEIADFILNHAVLRWAFSAVTVAGLAVFGLIAIVGIGAFVRGVPEEGPKEVPND